jgi:cytidyltransferase-like protein
MKRVIVSGAFDDLRFRDFRFLEEASKLGEVHAQLWSDEATEARTGQPPKFPLAEREYFLRAIRWVGSVTVTSVTTVMLDRTDIVVTPDHFSENLLTQAPAAPDCPINPAGEKVVVTGCFDWFHSGHVRFCEECSELGDLYVIVGNDANITHLKGEGHPLFPAVERRFIVGAVRYVKQALITTGMGWMDAEPEILCLKPQIYAVNEDGDKPEKREFCDRHGIEYKVLKRAPKAGLPRRQSTVLRGF